LIRSKLLTAIGGSGEGGNVYIGQKEFLSPGYYYWSVPLSVTRIHVCCIGAGAFNDYALTTTYNGGGGGGLVWANDIDVEPGKQLLIRVGASEIRGDDRHSTVGLPKKDVEEFDEIFLQAYGGSSSGPGGGYDLQGRAGGGGVGGQGSDARLIQNNGLEVWGGAGGGAGGYQGNGGRGDRGGNGASTIAGNGGAGAGGLTYWRLTGYQGGHKRGAGGGGVGVKGVGASGPSAPVQAEGQDPIRGNPGSSGTGADFGAGGGNLFNESPLVAPDYAKPGGGAVRIIWGIKYSYPNNADVSQ
jgi:hypothetical protein